MYEDVMDFLKNILPAVEFYTFIFTLKFQLHIFAVNVH
jgi:hypothetical protein